MASCATSVGWLEHFGLAGVWDSAGQTWGAGTSGRPHSLRLVFPLTE